MVMTKLCADSLMINHANTDCSFQRFSLLTFRSLPSSKFCFPSQSTIIIVEEARNFLINNISPKLTSIYVSMILVDSSILAHIVIFFYAKNFPQSFHQKLDSKKLLRQFLLIFGLPYLSIKISFAIIMIIKCLQFFQFFVQFPNSKTQRLDIMSTKKRNFVTQKVIPQSRTTIDLKIQNEEVNAFQIKFEAYNHFLVMVSQNHETLISDYSRRLLEQHQLLQDLAGPTKENADESISEIHNSMFMLKIQNEKLKCKQKLLRQKLQCQKLLYRQRKQESTGVEKQRRMRIEQIKLLKEEVAVLQSIVEKKKKLKAEQQKKQHFLEFVGKIKQIIQQENAENLESKLKQFLTQQELEI